MSGPINRVVVLDVGVPCFDLDPARPNRRACLREVGTIRLERLVFRAIEVRPLASRPGQRRLGAPAPVTTEESPLVVGPCLHVLPRPWPVNNPQVMADGSRRSGASARTAPAARRKCATAVNKTPHPAHVTGLRRSTRASMVRPPTPGEPPPNDRPSLSRTKLST
jgi:hypothetical protein